MALHEFPFVSSGADKKYTPRISSLEVSSLTRMVDSVCFKSCRGWTVYMWYRFNINDVG